VTFPRARLCVATLTVTVGLVLLAPPALADVPSGWPDSEPVNLMHALLVYVFAPLGLFVLIAVAAIVPSLARGERGADGTGSDQWFGGPRTGPHELESGRSDTTAGGASGSW
jgi:uncharacterized membrane protein YgcG